jgi:hypothetical protein
VKPCRTTGSTASAAVAAETRESTRQDEPEDERRGTAEERDPGRERRPALVQGVAEVARVRELKGDPGPEPDRERADREQPGEHGGSACNRERERDEPGSPPGLRDRHGVGEVGEQAREENEDEDGEEAADHERPPAAPGGEAGQRHGEEREHRHRAGTTEHLRRQPIVAV